jgi:ABC-2 type transport system permease protein
VAAHVLRLRVALLLGALRGHRRGRTLFTLAVVVALTVAVCVAVLSLVDVPVAVARTVIVLGSAAILLGFLVGPILVGAVDQLDPRRFAVFGVDERQMPWILVLAAFVSVPSLALIAVNACMCIVAIQLGTPWPAAVLMTLLGVVTSLLAARIGMAVNGLLLPERRSRELTALFALAIIVIAFPVAVFLASLRWEGQVPGAVAALTGTIGLTPLASSSGFLFAVAAGDTDGAWAGGVIAVLTAAVLWAVWTWLVRRALTTTDRPVSSRERTGLGWFGLLPSNAFGAIAARSLVYWFRDRRYIMNLIVVPVAGVLTVLPLLVAGVPLEIAALIPVPLMALFFGWLPHNDVAYDSTALWTHVASGVKGVPDRIGRLIPVLLVAVPVLAVSVPLTLLWIDDWRLLLPLTGLAASLLFAALGISSVVSVTAPYAVSRPGDSPFQQPQRPTSRGAFGPASAFLGAIALSIPTLWFFVLTVSQGSEFAPATLWAGLATGIVVLAAGVAIGGRVFERSGERLMEFVETA